MFSSSKQMFDTIKEAAKIIPQETTEIKKDASKDSDSQTLTPKELIATYASLSKFRLSSLVIFSTMVRL